MAETVGVTLLGSGVVGRGVLELLEKQSALLQQRTGLSFDIRHVVTRNPTRHADLAAQYALSEDALAAINDPAVKIVVEVMGGLTPAFE